MKKPACFVTTIDLKLAPTLKSDLIDQGFEMKKPPYTLFAAQKKGISCTLYTSGKLTVQGKDKNEFIEFYLEPEILQSFTYTNPEINYTPRIGIDESGKGDFFGPLCVAGVYADEKKIEKLLEIGVRDSKTMQASTIEKLAAQIRKICPVKVLKIFPKKYNELYSQFRNLNSLLGWGHATTIEALVEKTHCQEAHIDQFASEHVVKNALKKKNLHIKLTQRHRGEEDPVVAAASIIARSSFVEGLDKLSEEWGIELIKGASGKVKTAGRAFISKWGEEELHNVAKLHFKTTKEL